MSKNYLCKDCDHNNNGWCNKLRKQGLKDITECESKTVNGIDLNTSLNSNTEDFTPHRVYGKIEMLNTICRQIIAIESDGKTEISLDKLKSLLVNLNTTLEVDSKIFGVSITDEMDKAIIESNKAIIKEWKKTLNK